MSNKGHHRSLKSHGLLTEMVQNTCNKTPGGVNPLCVCHPNSCQIGSQIGSQIMSLNNINILTASTSGQDIHRSNHMAMNSDPNSMIGKNHHSAAYQSEWPGGPQNVASKSTQQQSLSFISRGTRGIKKKSDSSNSPTEKLKYACDYMGCNWKFDRLDNLQRHQRTHNGEKPFKCTWPGCNWSFAQTSTLKTHQRIHTGEKPYICDAPNCGKQFSRVDYLTKHQKIHTDWTTATRHERSKAFRSKTGRETKKRLTHTMKRRKYACDFNGCSWRFNRLDNLQRHQQTHNGIRPFKCEWHGCGKSFAQPSSLKNHIRVHTGEKPYICDAPNCGKQFSRVDYLTKHQKIHLNWTSSRSVAQNKSVTYITKQNISESRRRAEAMKRRKFACDYIGCCWRFKRLDNLQRHRQTHSGMKPYKCEWIGCSKTFAQPSTLKTHQRTHTGEKPYSCHSPNCGKRFSRLDYLKRHQKIHLAQAANQHH